MAAVRCAPLGLMILLLLAAPTGAVQIPHDPHGLQAQPEEPPLEEHMVRSEDHWIASHDGTQLAATLWYDENRTEAPLPVVLAAHGWSQDRHYMSDTAGWLVAQGYVVMAWDARGFGQSEGTVGLNGPDEWGDVEAIIDWIVDHQSENGAPQVQLDGEDDPRLGMVGASYGGAIQLLAAAHDPRIDAIVPEITWNDLVRSLAPNDVVKRGWVDLLFWSGTGASHGLLNTPPEPNTGGMDQRLAAWYLEATATGRLPEDAQGPLMERSPVTHMDDVQAHVLLAQGWHDTLFWPVEAVDSYHSLKDRANAETHLLFYPGGHGHSMGEDQRAAYRAQVATFLGRHLHEAQVDPLPPVTVYDPDRGNWTHHEQWPPTAEATTLHFDEDGPSTRTLAVLPAATSHTELQNFQGDSPDLSRDLLAEEEAGTAIRVTTGLQGPLTFEGQPRLEIPVTPSSDDVTLFFSLVETIGDDAKILYDQVSPIRVESPGQQITLNLTLSHLAHTLTAGKRLELRVATSDTGYHQARSAGTVALHLEGAVIDFPVTGSPSILRDETEGEGQQNDAPLGTVLPLALLAILELLRGRRRPPQNQENL